MVHKADRLMLSGNQNLESRYIFTPVTLWKLEERDSSLVAVKKSDVCVEGNRYEYKDSIDFDGNLAVITFRGGPGFSRICIWDLVQHVVLRWISYADYIKDVSIDTTSRRLVVASINTCNLQVLTFP